LQKAWNLFFEEFATFAYLLELDEHAECHFGFTFPEEKSQVPLWLKQHSCEAEALLDYFTALATVVRYERSSHCPFYWSLHDCSGDPVDVLADPLVAVFDSDAHVLGFSTANEGSGHYTLCAHNVWNADYVCFNINVSVDYGYCPCP
jgi:hypothetical protein